MGQLKQILREQILAEMTYDRQMADEEIADLIDRKMDACMENDPETFPATLGERLKLHKELFDSFRRLDILQELVDDPRVTEIMVNGPDQVFVETGGKIGRWEKSFESREQLEDLIQQIVSSVNRIVNTSTPLIQKSSKTRKRVQRHKKNLFFFRKDLSDCQRKACLSASSDGRIDSDDPSGLVRASGNIGPDPRDLAVDCHHFPDNIIPGLKLIDFFSGVHLFFCFFRHIDLLGRRNSGNIPGICPFP
jgi:hypothetical protein